MENSPSTGNQVVLDTFRSELNLDCVSFCPVSGYENLLLVAKYEQNQQDFTHSGGILLFDTKNKYNSTLIFINISGNLKKSLKPPLKQFSI